VPQWNGTIRTTDGWVGFYFALLLFFLG